MTNEERLENSMAGARIEDVMRHWTELTPNGKRFDGICPVCGEKKLSVDGESQLFYCFGCGVGGTAANFVMDRLGMNFFEACDYIKNRGYEEAPICPWCRCGMEYVEMDIHPKLDCAYYQCAKCKASSPKVRIHERGSSAAKETAYNKAIAFYTNPANITMCCGCAERGRCERKMNSKPRGGNGFNTYRFVNFCSLGKREEAAPSENG